MLVASTSPVFFRVTIIFVCSPIKNPVVSTVLVNSISVVSKRSEYILIDALYISSSNVMLWYQNSELVTHN